jgi:RNA polymerase sigma factor (sigma-70 family)
MTDMPDREIYEEVRGPLMRFAASLVGPHDAADLVSEAVVATLRRRSLASLDNPQAYLMRSVLNRARSRARSAIRERGALARLGAPAHGPAADDGLSDVAQTVAALPPRQRAAVYLVHWEGMSPTEAARHIGVRPATLRRYLHLAHKRLRRHLV